ncbi:hypothetical protein, partial [Romboutsia sp.]|uniref:hypothetical protein n=1 Tax=Romboutsia sp. TaxID=1965302 RepID=UPI002BC1F274
KVFDNKHNILDEVHEFSGLTYTKTLNGVGKCEFSIPLNSFKCTKENFTETNHVEIYRNDEKVWGGFIVQTEFNFPNLKIGCYGYLGIFMFRRLRAKDYVEQTYTNLFKSLLIDINNISSTGIIEGYFDSNSLRTQRKVENKDFALDKMLEYANSANYYIEVNENREFNFYTAKERKLQYELIYGTEESDNIINAPSLSRSILDMANNVYAESEHEEEGVKTILTSLKQDANSINKYGLFEGVYNANNDIVIQNTLDNYVNDELSKRAYPSDTVSLKVANSNICPIHNLKVGDIIPIYLKPYFEYKDEVKILEITIDATKQEADIVVGQKLYKQQKPITIMYAK